MNESLDIFVGCNINRSIRKHLDMIDIGPTSKYKDESHFIRIAIMDKLKIELGVDNI